MKKYILVIVILIAYWFIFDISISSFIIATLLGVPTWIFAFLITYLGVFIGAKIYGHEIFYFRFIFLECFITDGKMKFKLCQIYFDKQISIKPNDKKSLSFVYSFGEIANIIVGSLCLILYLILFPNFSDRFYIMLTLLLFSILNIGFGAGGLIFQLRRDSNSYLRSIKDENGLVAARSIYKINYNLATTKDIEDIDDRFFVYTDKYGHNYFESYNYLLEIEKLICLGQYDEAYGKIKSASLDMNKYLKANLRHYEIFLLLIHKKDYEKAKKLYKSGLIKETFDSMNAYVIRSKILYEVLIEEKPTNMEKYHRRLDYYSDMRQIGFRKIEDRLNDILYDFLKEDLNIKGGDC